MDKIIVRQADKEDAASLYMLNEEFNGNGLNTIQNIESSIEKNKHEIVCIVEVNEKAIGFCCAQIISSMCYESNYAEITELFIMDEFRRRGFATMLVEQIESICCELHNVRKFHLLTGTDNFNAHELYKSLGYIQDDELHFVRRIK